jgi:hypothetical protein
MRHDWMAWLHERDAPVLLLRLMQAVEAPDTTLYARWRRTTGQPL